MAQTICRGRFHGASKRLTTCETRKDRHCGVRCRHRPEEGRFTRADVDRLLQQAWREFDRLAPLVPQEPTIGSRMNVRLACFTLAFLQATTAAGVERSYAIELMADVEVTADHVKLYKRALLEAGLTERCMEK